jgi:Putative polyhydroxyalkanoic acid system protein (PHA_gran_rgn)
MEIDFPYELSDQDARGRLDILSQYLANKHGIQVTWVEPAKAKFSGKYLVVRIDGELTLGNGRAQFRGEDPGFLWRGRAKEYIQDKLAKYLDPRNPPEKLPTS